MDYNYLIAFLLLLISTNVSAELSDPTKPIDYDTIATISNEPIVNDNIELKLSAIIFSDSIQHAIINGRLVKRGDIIFPSIVVLEIHEKSVNIQINNYQQILHIIPSIKYTQPSLQQGSQP